jgi:hypothetical protein
MHGENALDAFAVGDTADGEALGDATALAADHDASEDLDTFLVAFAHFGVHAHAVADLELHEVGLELVFGDVFENRLHGERCLVRCIRMDTKIKGLDRAV